MPFSTTGFADRKHAVDVAGLLERVIVPVCRCCRMMKRKNGLREQTQPFRLTDCADGYMVTCREGSGFRSEVFAKSKQQRVDILGGVVSLYGNAHELVPLPVNQWDFD